MESTQHFFVQVTNRAETRDLKFRLRHDTRVDLVEGRVQQYLGVVGGILSYNKNDLEVVDVLEADKLYYFVGFSASQAPPPPAPPGISQDFVGQEARETGRKRARTDYSLAGDAVYQLQMATKKLSHMNEDEGEGAESHKTCFYIGEWTVIGSNEKNPMWVTALHCGLKLGMSVRIRKNLVDLEGTVIYACEQSDVAIIATSIVPFCDPLKLQSRRYELKSVALAGFGDSINSGEDKPAITACHISKVDAWPATGTAGLHQHLPADKYSRWRTSRFFLLDKTTDFGFSGAPVVDSFGDVIGMLCASEYVNFSWALKSDFIVDALAECVTKIE